MLVLLPVLTLGACILACKSFARCWQEATLAGAIVWGILLVGLTELLSLVHALTVVGLAAAWATALVSALFFVLQRLGWPPLLRPRGPADRLTLALLVPLGLQLAVLGGIAVVSPPNTWDSMSYHMARLIHWQQSASVAPYPAYVLRQLYMPPGAEFIMLHLQILSGGDQLAGLVQWTAMIGVLIGISLIARRLGAHRSGALCAVMFAASVPIGVVESTSTQNDQVLTFWLVCVLVFALELVGSSNAGARRGAALGFGASLGLALITKATAYVWVAPVLVWVALNLLRNERRRGLALLAASGAIALAVNAGFYTRNMMVFGQPLGQTDEGIPSLRYLNDTFEPPLFAANVARDLGINLVATPFPTVNAQAEAVVVGFHRWLGVDLTDPRTTWSGERFRAQAPELAFNESFASNPIHLVVILVALIGMWPLRRTLSPRVVEYGTVVLAGLLLFAAVVRWQPWHARLELPFFALGAPLVGVVVERASRRLAFVLAGLLLIAMVPWVVANDTRALVGPRSILSSTRTERYFTNWPTVRPQYLAALALLAERGCTRVGFMSSADGWEYPLWALLPGVQEIEQINPPNVSVNLVSGSDRGSAPCAVLALGPAADAQVVDVWGKEYQRVWKSGKDLEGVAVLVAAQA